MMVNELPTNRAQSRLSEKNYTPHDAVIEFYAHLLQMDSEAIDLRHEISSEDLGLTGFKKWRTLKTHELSYVGILDDSIEAREAVIHGEPHRFERVDTGFAEAENDFSRSRPKITKQLNSTVDELARTRRTLTEKQNAATTRMGLTLSVVAVAISMISVLVSVGLQYL
ncbi:hypothetical protein [Halorussus ruber]|uniref:hypothetical protein n=1 Tax=Halorussus ruber TaxID=1126238 RepID=UPI00143E05BB|nr:hypothetical protein [Halorussus ruber]